MSRVISAIVGMIGALFGLTRRTHPRRWVPTLLTAVLAVAVAVFGAGPASAATTSAAQTRVGASTSAEQVAVGPSASISAGQRLGSGLAQRQIVVATGVAANGGVLRHYTTSAAAENILKEGAIKPGAASGRVWLTPDTYVSGAEAQARLALKTTPDGYFEVPMCRVRCASSPSPVQPIPGQPGGGVEVTTPFKVPVGDLPFIKFK